MTTDFFSFMPSFCKCFQSNGWDNFVFVLLKLSSHPKDNVLGPRRFLIPYCSERSNSVFNTNNQDTKIP